MKCVTCEEVLVVPVETPMLGHKVTALKAVAATCTTAGKTEGSQCSRCGEVLKEQTVISAKGHTVVEAKGYAPTCTEAGKTNGSMCSACGKVYSEQEDIPATGHNIVSGVCTVCGDINEEEYLTAFTDSSKYTEETVEVGEKIVGNVYRLYRTEETKISNSRVGCYSSFLAFKSNDMIYSFAVTSLAHEDGVVHFPNTETGENTYMCSSLESACIAVGGVNSPIIYTINLSYVVYEDYIDIYVEEGTHIVYGADGSVRNEVCITSETVVESLYGHVVRLELKSAAVDL